MKTEPDDIRIADLEKQIQAMRELLDQTFSTANLYLNVPEINALAARWQALKFSFDYPAPNP